MLAQIVVETHARWALWVAVSGDDEEVLFGSAHHHAEDADLLDS